MGYQNQWGEHIESEHREEESGLGKHALAGRVPPPPLIRVLGGILGVEEGKGTAGLALGPLPECCC